MAISDAFILGSGNLPPSINGPPANVPIKTNGSATLRCSVSGEAQISWYTGSPFTSFTQVPAAANSHYTLEEDGASLVISEFRNLHHGGDYTCKAESSSSSSSLYSCPGTVTHASMSMHINIIRCC